MNVTVSGKNIEITDALRDNVTFKLEKFGKFFKEDTEAQATLSVQKNRKIIEITIPINGSILRVEEATDDMYTSMDKALDKLNRQIEKHKTKLEKRYKGHNTIRFEYIPDTKEKDIQQPSIVRTKRFAIKPMDTEEAILQMELLAHSFFVYMNADTDDVNVVYKRKDGNYGLIEPTF